MCVVSMVGDWGRDKITDPGYPNWPLSTPAKGVASASKAELERLRVELQSHKTQFEALRRDVLEIKELLARAKDYDARNNEPDCEIEDKVILLKKIAELVGVDLADVFKK